MAKLQGVNFGRVSPVVGPGPEQAVREAAQRRELFNQVAEAAQQIGEARREFAVASALAEYNEENSAFRRRMDEYDSITPAEAEVISKEFNVKLDFEGREHLRKNEWYPQLLEKQLEESRNRHLSKIEYMPDRQQVEARVRNNELVILERESKLAASQAREAENKAQIAKIYAAMQRGEYDTAQTLTEFASVYDGTPEIRQAKLQEIARGKEFQTFDMMLIGGRYDEAMDLLEDPERPTNLSSKEIRTLYMAAASQETNAVAAERERIGQVQDANFVEALAGLNTGDVTGSDIIAARKNFSPAHFNTLTTLSRTLTNEAARGDTAKNQAVVANFQNQMILAQAGIMPDGMSLQDYSRQLRDDIIGATTALDDEGNVVPGITASQSMTLLTSAMGMQEVIYDAQGYKQTVEDLKLRVMGPTAIGIAPDVSTSARMADALNSLHSYIDNEQAAGRVPDLARWRDENLNRYVQEGAEDVLAAAPEVLKNMIRRTETGEFDFQATAEYLAETRASLTDPEQIRLLDSHILELQSYYDLYEERLP